MAALDAVEALEPPSDLDQALTADPRRASLGRVSPLRQPRHPGVDHQRQEAGNRARRVRGDGRAGG